MDQELIAYLEERFRENSRQIMEGVRSEVGTLRQEMVSRFEQVDEAIQQNGDEIRRTQDNLRHTQIVVEALRSDLQGVAEGVMSTNQRLDVLREEMQQEFKEVRRSTRLAYTDINQRVLSLEEWRKRVGEDPVPRVRKKS